MLTFFILLLHTQGAFRLPGATRLAIRLRLDPNNKLFYMVMAFGKQDSEVELRNVLPDTGSFYTVMRNKNDAHSITPIERKELTRSSSLKPVLWRQRLLDRECEHQNGKGVKFEGPNCQVSIQYGLKQEYRGEFVTENVRFPESNLPTFKFSQVFGCTRRIPDEPNRRKITGIMGLRARPPNHNYPPSFVETLFGSSREARGLVALCLGSQGGWLSIAQPNKKLHVQGATPIHILQPPNLNRAYDSGQLLSIYVDNELIYQGSEQSQTGYVKLFDSGTNTIGLLPIIYAAFIRAFSRFCRRKSSNCAGNDSYQQFFVARAQSGDQSLLNTFPNITFEFYGNSRYTLTPEGYFLLKGPEQLGHNFVGFFSTFKETEEMVFGSPFMHNHDFVFNIQYHKLIIYPAMC